MFCKTCEVTKVRDEFPPRHLGPGCLHGYQTCLRCTVAHCKSEGKCPQTQCKQIADQETIRQFENSLSIMFTANPPKLPGSDGPILYFATMTGLSFKLDDIDEEMTIAEIKERIRREYGYDINKQILFYDEQELEHFKQDGTPYKLRNYGIELGSTLQLMVLLYNIPKDINEVEFSLSWGFPEGGKQDYLDATCFLIDTHNDILPIDYRQHFFDGQKIASVRHGGDVVDADRGKASQKIEVDLKEIPKIYNYLVFTLSSYKSPTIKSFKSPTLSFAQKDSRLNLCTTSIKKALDSQAVIMCIVKRHYDTWRIIDGGYNSDGNSKNYDPLQKSITTIIHGLYPY